MTGPDPNTRHPMAGFPQVSYLKNAITRPNIVVGDFTYYDDPDGPERFEQNVMYHFPFIGDKLVIGKFCALAKDVKFVMNGANHLMSGISTYPFHIFGNGWERATPPLRAFPYKGDTVVGNDVWIGYDALVMPGVRIGDGAIVATRSVVTRDVPAYAIVAGNPATLIRLRFPDDVVAELLAIAWWNWSAEAISRNLEHIMGADVEALRRVGNKLIADS
ncbi:MAG: vat [Geminicoccaceae bacterium]|nr:vat [Geminicoccaceae bacterium]